MRITAFLLAAPLLALPLLPAPVGLDRRRQATNRRLCSGAAASLFSAKSVLAVAMAATLGLIATPSARADAITETFTFAPLAGYSSEDGTSFSAFDPALGTLNSVTYNLTATAIFSGGGDFDKNNAEYRFSFTGPGGISRQDATATATGNGPGSASLDLTDSDPSDIADYVGPGTVTSFVLVDNHGGTIASISSTFDTESVTYSYTPSAPPTVPEPGSLALLGSGLLGFLALRRRRPA